MMFRIWLMCIGLVSLGQPLQAQGDYIILNKGDTLRGQVRKPSALYLMHHQVAFVPEGDTKVYRFSPYELKGFGTADETYLSHYIRGANDEFEKKYLRVLVRGYCTLYRYRYARPSPRGGMMGQPEDVYFVERLNEPLHKLDIQKLAKGKDSFFDDNPALATEIRKGKYNEKTLPKLVERYNQMRLLQ